MGERVSFVSRLPCVPRVYPLRWRTRTATQDIGPGIRRGKADGRGRRTPDADRGRTNGQQALSFRCVPVQSARARGGPRQCRGCDRMRRVGASVPSIESLLPYDIAARLLFLQVGTKIFVVTPFPIKISPYLTTACLMTMHEWDGCNRGGSGYLEEVASAGPERALRSEEEKVIPKPPLTLTLTAFLPSFPPSSSLPEEQ